MALLASSWARLIASKDGLAWTGVKGASCLMGRLDWMFSYDLAMFEPGGDNGRLLSGTLGFAGRSANRKRRAIFDQKNPTTKYFVLVNLTSRRLSNRPVFGERLPKIVSWNQNLTTCKNNYWPTNIIIFHSTQNMISRTWAMNV